MSMKCFEGTAVNCGHLDPVILCPGSEGSDPGPDPWLGMEDCLVCSLHQGIHPGRQED